jgi:uncharacterized membrane protein YqjE
MKLSVEIVAKFMSALILLLSGLGLLAVDDVEKLTQYVNEVVTGVFIIVGSLGAIRTVFKAKRHREVENGGAQEPG